MTSFDYNCGVIDAFNEVVKAGVKRLALSHPFNSEEEAKEYVGFVKEITSVYGNCYYLETELLISDLFATSLNRGKVVYLFYKDPLILEYYLNLKYKKQSLIQDGEYLGENRINIAKEFGNLLSYSEEAIEKYIQINDEKENV